MLIAYLQDSTNLRGFILTSPSLTFPEAGNLVPPEPTSRTDLNPSTWAEVKSPAKMVVKM